MLNPPVNGRIQVVFKAFKYFSGTFQGKFYFQGLSRTVVYIQVLSKPVRALYYTLHKVKNKGTYKTAQMLRLILYTFVVPICNNQVFSCQYPYMNFGGIN